MISRITASNVENNSFVQLNFKTKNPDKLISKFKDTISLSSADNVIVIKKEIKKIITYITALLHTNKDDPIKDYSTDDRLSDMSENELLNIADQLSKYINNKFNLALEYSFSCLDCMEILHLCMHRYRNFESI